jgi:hypothetical protein
MLVMRMKLESVPLLGTLKVPVRALMMKVNLFIDVPLLVGAADSVGACARLMTSVSSFWRWKRSVLK